MRIMRRMGADWRTLRLIAVVMVCVLALTVTAPARADAIDPLTAVAIGAAAVGVLLVVLFLVVANLADAKKASVPVLYACVEVEGQPRNCWPLSDAGPTPLLVAPEPAPAPQS